ncbi:MAG: hypothetical protein RMJ96_08655, partial [Candidatus Bipolaricaulota bacterium]|nr:hypothetical protein [Candidatus Bipolaricaulota bacterium]
YFKTYINPKYQAIPLPPPPQLLLELQHGAYIGGTKARVKFEIIDRGGCMPPCVGACSSFDDPWWPLLMAHAGVLLGRTPMNGIPITGAGGRTIEIKWFVALVRVGPDGKTTLEALIFYPDDKFRSPEEMLKAARSYDDGGILKPSPPGN